MILPSIPTEVVGQTGHPDAAAFATNSLGLDFLRQGFATGNGVMSPYSVQSALVLAFAGAGGTTRAEMIRTLHYAGHDATIHGSFGALRRLLEDAVAGSIPERQSRPATRHAGPGEQPAPDLVLAVANRVYAARGQAFAPAFLRVLADQHASPLVEADFAADAENARQEINTWVTRQTAGNIADLLPPGTVTPGTLLALINAVYLKAAWQDQFLPTATRPMPFHVNGRPGTELVSTMNRSGQCGHLPLPGATALVLPYRNEDLQFVVLLPDSPAGLPGLEATVTPELLAKVAQAPRTEARISLPRFKVDPSLVDLKELLGRLGMPSAFGDADFRGMLARQSPNAIRLSNVFHKTVVQVNEAGTEAAAASAVMVEREIRRTPSLEVAVNRPFLFAVQHRPTGACLFLGRVVDPR